jgi:hypothetical protein
MPRAAARAPSDGHRIYDWHEMTEAGVMAALEGIARTAG